MRTTLQVPCTGDEKAEEFNARSQTLYKNIHVTHKQVVPHHEEPRRNKCWLQSLSFWQTPEDNGSLLMDRPRFAFVPLFYSGFAGFCLLGPSRAAVGGRGKCGGLRDNQALTSDLGYILLALPSPEFLCYLSINLVSVRPGWTSLVTWLQELGPQHMLIVNLSQSGKV